MITAARVVDGVVTDLMLVNDLSEFPKSIAAFPGVAVGWTFDGTTFLPPPVDPAVYSGEVSRAVQALLDAKAIEFGYDSILSAVSYRGSQHPKFGPEAEAFAVWRDAVWDYCYTQLSLGLSGQRAVPTIDGFLAELPLLGL